MLHVDSTILLGREGNPQRLNAVDECTLAALAAAIGAGVPAGANGEIQYNNAGIFGGTSLWTFTPTFLQANWDGSGVQVCWNMTGNDLLQNVPFRVNAHTDVPTCFCTDGIVGNSAVSQIAISIDALCLSTKKHTDPDYTAYVGWSKIGDEDDETAHVVFRGFSNVQDASTIIVYIGADPHGSGQNQVNIGNVYFLPYTFGNNGDVLTITDDSNGVTSFQPPAAGFINPMTTKGDLIIGDTGGTPIRLPIGTTGQVPTVTAGGTLAYSTLSFSGAPSGRNFLTGGATTSSATLTTISGLNATIVTVGSNGVVAIWVMMTVSMVGTGVSGFFQLQIDGVNISNGGLIGMDNAGAISGDHTPVMLHGTTTGLSAGSHTVSVQWSISPGGSITLVNQASVSSYVTALQIA